jgi:hypothetical protein
VTAVTIKDFGDKGPRNWSVSVIMLDCAAFAGLPSPPAMKIDWGGGADTSSSTGSACHRKLSGGMMDFRAPMTMSSCDSLCNRWIDEHF